MPDGDDQVRDALRRSGDGHRRRVLHAANAMPVPGASAVPERLLSETGFFQDAGFYYAPCAADLGVVRSEEPRAITRVVLRAFGLREDWEAFERTPPDVAQFFDTSSGDAVYRPTGYDLATRSNPRNVRREITNLLVSGNPGAHVIVDRTGAVWIGPGLDVELPRGGSLATTSVFVAIESGYAKLEPDRDAAAYEVPWTLRQIQSLVVVLAKLRVAYPALADVPLVYETEEPAPPPGLYNLASATQPDVPAFVYDGSLPASLERHIAREPHYRLATDVFVRRTHAAPSASRASAYTALSQRDTLLLRANILGIYADLAAPERAYEMQSATREQIFQVRRGQARHAADQADTAATTVARTAPPAIMSADDRTLYNFEAMLWKDGQLY